MELVPLHPDCVVSIHECMDGVVHSSEEIGKSNGVCSEGIPGVGAHCHMVVPMEEGKRSLAEDDESRVSKLRTATSLFRGAVAVATHIRQGIIIDVAMDII